MEQRAGLSVVFPVVSQIMNSYSKISTRHYSTCFCMRSGWAFLCFTFTIAHRKTHSKCSNCSSFPPFRAAECIVHAVYYNNLDYSITAHHSILHYCIWNSIQFSPHATWQKIQTGLPLTEQRPQIVELIYRLLLCACMCANLCVPSLSHNAGAVNPVQMGTV